MYALIVSVMIASTGSGPLNMRTHTTINRTFATQEACASAMNRALASAMDPAMGHMFAGWRPHPNGRLEVCGTL